MRKIIVLRENECILSGPVYRADTFISRFLGLMGKKNIGEEEGIFFTKTSRIHTSFMRFPIDVVYFNDNMVVIYIETIYPWKVGSFVKYSKHLLEINKDMGKKFTIGDKIAIVDG